jgi:hypothetical protein
MNLFRSEEDIRNWVQFDAGTEEGIIGLDDLLKLFSGRYFRKRLDPDWFSHSREYVISSEESILRAQKGESNSRFTGIWSAMKNFLFAPEGSFSTNMPRLCT